MLTEIYTPMEFGQGYLHNSTPFDFNTTDSTMITSEDWALVDDILQGLEDPMADTLLLVQPNIKSAANAMKSKKSKKNQCRKLCQHVGCNKQARRKGVCALHGGVKTCSVEGCSKISRSYGKCNEHK